MFPTCCDAMFLSSDVALNSKTQQQLPPPFLFPFSPSIVHDVEFLQQYHHHHQELISNSSQQQQQQQQQQDPLTIDTSSETIAESDQTYNNMEASGLVINSTANTSTMITTNNNNIKNKNKKKELSSTINDSSSGGRGSGSSNKYFANSSLCGSKSTVIRKRSAKKDRHSKIVTAQGPRDRRMRLSLDIARRFFTLQDMLGFDKASKTVEWLLNNSRSAIKEFAAGKGSSSHSKNNNISCSAKSGSSYTSECEVVSGIDTVSNEEVHHEHQLEHHHHQEQEITKCSEGTNTQKEKRTRQARKATFHPFGRESRAKARERARERNIKRIMTRLSQQQCCPDSSNLHGFNPFESVEESGTHTSYDLKSNSLEMVAQEVEKPPSSSESLNKNIICESLLNSTRPSVVSVSSIFSYQDEISRLLSPRSKSSFPGFDENWEVQNPRVESSRSYCTSSNNRHHQSAGEVLENCIPSSFSLPSTYETRLQSQFTDATGFCSKINWETFNNRSLS